MKDPLIERKIPSGLLDKSIEFFAASVDEIPYIANNGQISSCSDMDEGLYQTMLKDAKSNLKWWGILNKWHAGDERRMVYQHIACRYGALNSTPDLDDEGKLSAEVRVCDRCLSCEGFGEGCARIENLSHREMLAVVLIAQGLGDKQIAEEMGISRFTLNEYKRRLSAKLKAHSKIEIINKFYKKIM